MRKLNWQRCGVVVWVVLLSVDLRLPFGKCQANARHAFALARASLRGSAMSNGTSKYIAAIWLNSRLQSENS